MRIIDSIEDWNSYIEELTNENKKPYHVNEPEEFPCIVVSNLHRKNIIDDDNEKKRICYYEHRFVYTEQAERLLQLV